MFRPVGACGLVWCVTQGGARALLALGWFVGGLWPVGLGFDERGARVSLALDWLVGGPLAFGCWGCKVRMGKALSGCVHLWYYRFQSPCHNHSPVSFCMLSSARRTVFRFSEMSNFALDCMLTWRAFCKTLGASRSLLVVSKIMYTFFAISNERSPSLVWWRR